MASRGVRQSDRLPCTLPVLVAWTDADGDPRYAQGKCLDISQTGLRVQTPGTVPPNSNVTLRVQRVDLAGSARVRYVRRRGDFSIIGLELSERVRQQLLDLLRNSPTGSSS